MEFFIYYKMFVKLILLPTSWIFLDESESTHNGR